MCRCDTVLGVQSGMASLVLGVVIVLGGCAGASTSAAVSTDEVVVASGPSATPMPSARPSLDLSTYSISDPTSRWVVVNKQRPLSPSTYAPVDLQSVGGGQVMRADAAEALTQMIRSASAAQLSLHAVSGYRSYSYQVSVHASAIADQGTDDAEQASARPGYSEHQTGWAVDVGGGGCDVEECFADTTQGSWVAANSWRYGFIVRYPPDTMAITGYEYEPWHLRWVDVPLATYLHDRHIPTLEQAFGLPAARSY